MVLQLCEDDKVYEEGHEPPLHLREAAARGHIAQQEEAPETEHEQHAEHAPQPRSGTAAVAGGCAFVGIILTRVAEQEPNASLRVTTGVLGHIRRYLASMCDILVGMICGSVVCICIYLSISLHA